MERVWREGEGWIVWRRVSGEGDGRGCGDEGALIENFQPQKVIKRINPDQRRSWMEGGKQR